MLQWVITLLFQNNNQDLPPTYQNRSSGPMLSISRNVRLFVRLFVCVFIFRSGLRFEHFRLKIVKNRREIFFFFFCWFCLTKHGGNHASRWIRDLWLKGVLLILAYLETFLSFCVLDDFFHFSKKSGFGIFLVHPETRLPNGLETSGQRAYR